MCKRVTGGADEPKASQRIWRRDNSAKGKADEPLFSVARNYSKPFQINQPRTSKDIEQNKKKIEVPWDFLSEVSVCKCPKSATGGLDDLLLSIIQCFLRK